MNVFVFGSNREGRHSKGAALEARKKYGAIYGQASGRMGSSYGIVTKELRHNWPPVSLNEIQLGVDGFLENAILHPQDTFMVTAIGCGLAGFKAEQIAPMFRNAPDNVKLPEEFKTALEVK